MERNDVIKSMRACSDAGQLALAVYLVHGFPSLQRSKAAFDHMKARGVTVTECGLPVSSFHGSAMSDIIREAHHVAASAGLSDEAMLEFYAGYRPNLLIHIADAGRQVSEMPLERVRSAVDAVMTDRAEFAQALRLEGSGPTSPLTVRFISALSPELPREAGSLEPDDLVYLGVASRTGGAMLPTEQIQEAVGVIVKAAPNATILCGFGIRDAHDVARLRDVRGVHGVAIGSEAMRRLKVGMREFEVWLSDVQSASGR